MAHQTRFGIGFRGTDSFWVQILESIYERSLQHSVELVPMTQSSFSLVPTVEEQSAFLEDVISQELDVCLGWHFPEALAYTALNSGLGIVHLSETTIEHPLSASPVGLRKIAEEIAEYLARLLDYRGHILVIGGLMQADMPDDGRSRIAGFEDVFSEFPNLQYHHIPTDWGDDAASRQVAEALAAAPFPVDGIVGLSDTLALVAQRIAIEMGRADTSTPVMGINGDPQALAAINEGRMTATVETPPTGLANQAFDIALKIAYGQPYPPHFEYNPRLITAANVAKVAAEKLVAIANLPNRLVGADHQALQEYQNYLETSLDISRQIGSVLNSEHLQIKLAALIRAHFGYDHVQLFSWSEQEQVLTLIEDGDSKPAVRVPLLTAGVLGDALTLAKPVFIPDTQRSFRYPPDPAWPTTRSRVILPIRLGGKITGLLDLHASRGVRATRQHLMGLQSLADQLGVAVQNAKLYQEALQAKAAAEKADQLKSRLLANISHELRNPLHVILGYTEKMEVPAQAQSDLQHIKVSADHLLRLINDLLDLSRAEIDELSIAPEIVEPISFLRETFDSMADHAQDGQVSWRLQLPDRLPIIQADSDRLRQIMLNLLSNARKFTARGEITLGADITSPYLHIWVQDTGTGIPVQLQQHIFEPFVTAHQNGKRKEGVGLGLSITRRLVALHRGLMTVDSQPGEGSAFHVYLPLPNLSNTPLAPTTDVQPILLLVSAREALSAELADYCRSQGLELYRICSYDDVDSVLSRGLPATVAWDADAANESEWQIIQRLRSHPELCHLPFLLYGQASNDSARITNILLKPVKPKTLLSMVSALFEPDDSGLILIVDDDPEARALYQEIVTGQLMGYTCRIATTGKEALAVMEKSLPRLVILDLMMPEMDGFEVIRRMRLNPRTQHIPVIVLSGKILTFEDIKRLEPYQRIMYQSKQVLTDDELASSLQRMLLDNQALPTQTSSVVKHAVAYIHQNYEKPLSRSEIARELGVSKNYLTQIFHQELGISLWDYLNRYRVMQAKELLRRTHDSIAYISSQVGFDDPAYFSRVFQRYAGQSPRVYRNTPDPLSS